MNLQYLLELIGMGFFSNSGALAANEKSKPDWFRVTIIGFVTSLGSGSTRDLLLGSYPLVYVVAFLREIFFGMDSFYLRILRRVKQSYLTSIDDRKFELLHSLSKL